MTEYINKELALSMPFANDQYDHEHADKDFILGLETYKEWLETLPTIEVSVDKDDGVHAGYLVDWDAPHEI